MMHSHSLFSAGAAALMIDREIGDERWSQTRDWMRLRFGMTVREERTEGRRIRNEARLKYRMERGIGLSRPLLFCSLQRLLRGE